MDESIALVEFSKHSERVWSTPFDYARIEVGLKLWNPPRYRCYDPRTVVDDDASAKLPGLGQRRVLRGVRGMVFDTASLAVLLQSVGARGRRGHALVRAAMDCAADDGDGPLGRLLHDGKACAGLFSLRTTNAARCGARRDVACAGMLRAEFDDGARLARLDLSFDVLAVMRQLQGARDGADLDLVPNTLAAAERAMIADDDDAARGRRRGRGRPRLVVSSARPHVIARANAAFSELCGFSAAEAVGRTLRLIEGPATDAAVVDDLLRDVELRLPSSMIVVNYRRDGTKFINYLRVFPLAGDGDAADDFGHYLAELERLDDEAVAAIENAPGPPPPRWHLAPAGAPRAPGAVWAAAGVAAGAPAFVPPHVPGLPLHAPPARGPTHRPPPPPPR